MTTSPTTTTVEHEVGPQGSVSVRGIDGSIDVRAGDGPTVRLRGTGRRDLEEDYRVIRGAGELRIEAVGLGGTGLRWFRTDRAQALELEVPRRATVTIETASGSIDANGLQGEQRYRTVSGEMRLTGVGGHVVIDGVSGDVALRADARIDLEARVVSADLEASAPEFAVVRVKTASGDLRLEGSLAEGAEHSIATISGDTSIRSTGPIVVDGRTISGDLHTRLPHRSDGGPGRRTLQVGEGGPRVAFRSISGGLTVVGPGAVSAPVPAAPPVAVGPLVATDPAVPDPVLEATELIPEAPAGATGPASEDSDRLRVLRDLEAGRIDVDEAGRRLADIDEGTSNE
jgi:hypothetical protein